MNLVSTRNIKNQVAPAEAIAGGLACDGGLFAPVSLPSFTMSKIAALGSLSYSELVAYVASPFLSDFTREEISCFTKLAYTNFPEHAAPIVSLNSSTHILELFHGPTCAFKDFALQLLPHLLSASLKKIGIDKTALILTATSGDTGSAALEGFGSVSGTKICVFYPNSGISSIQRLQMTSREGKNLKVIGIEGNFDDAQSGVKGIFNNSALVEHLDSMGYILSSANSINWGRIVPQIAYYFSAYATLVSSGAIAAGDSINVSVPTGNFGNILAAYYAKKCGLPVNKLICASNANNVLSDFINTGIYDKNRSFHATNSPSMDILISSNLERFLFDLHYHDDSVINCLMASLSGTGRYEISTSALSKMQSILYAGYSNDESTLSTINEVWSNCNYLCDTHTAVAIKIHKEYMEKTGDCTPTIIASTASPFKFTDSALEALRVPAIGNDFEKLARLSEKCNLQCPDALMSLDQKEELHKTVCHPEEMKEQILGWLGDSV